MSEDKPIPWRGFNALDKLVIVVLPLVAVGFALLPFLDEVFLRRIARVTGLRSFVAWLINDNGSWILAIAFMAVWGVYVLWKRNRLMNDKRLWSGTGCPNCMERELIRVSRNAGDRVYSLFGINAYRYACRNCTWRGMRIGRREHSPELDAALEEALLRFDPDESSLRTPLDSSANQADDIETKTVISVDIPQSETELPIHHPGEDLPTVDGSTTADIASSDDDNEIDRLDGIDIPDEVSENYLE
ncbi:MAG: hypothetical protein R6X18_14700 [Chloroflexota bacterium]